MATDFDELRSVIREHSYAAETAAEEILERLEVESLERRERERAARDVVRGLLDGLEECAWCGATSGRHASLEVSKGGERESVCERCLTALVVDGWTVARDLPQAEAVRAALRWLEGE